MSVEFENIEFQSEGEVLRGRLYRASSPAGAESLVIMAHGFSGTITMTLTDIASRFASAGFTTLVYDHRNFGASDGEPRGGFDLWTQIRGYRDAIGFALTLPRINPKQIVVWGESMSSLAGQFVAAFDDRVAALIAHTPVCGDNSDVLDKDRQPFEALRTIWSEVSLESLPTKSMSLQVVDLPGGSAPVVLPFDAARDYMLEYGLRAETKWQNEIIFLTRTTDPELSHQRAPAANIKIPTLFVIATDDEVSTAKPTVARHCFSLINAPKRKIEIPGGHFGLLHVGSEVYEQVVTADIEFLRTYL